MKLILFFIISACFSKSQEYKLTCFNFHIADVKQTIYETGKIKYDIHSRGIADLIWPTNNNYYTSFNTETFTLKSWGKEVEQGIYKSSLDAKFDSTNNVLKYGEKSIQTVEPIYTVFTMLAMAQALPFEILDTKWFPYEHQGKIGEARFLWSDSSMVWTGKDSIMCDHYRMDINILDSTFSIKEDKDYLMKNIIDENYVKELWIKRGKNRQVLKARVKNNWITFIARTNQ
tara:strand:+ start:115 stop:804 length:690 start_codon:yes stop_codon:yes gene_type:complete